MPILPDDVAAEVAEYFEASRCKIEVSIFHFEALGHVLDDYPPALTPLQAHFEGLFYAGVAAYEKLIPGLALAAGLRETALPHEVIAQLKNVRETEDVGRSVERWIYAQSGHGTVIWDEANDIRNAATHRFYDKQQGPPGHFSYSVAQTNRIRRRRDGMLAEFSEEWVHHVEQLRPILESAREEWDLPEVALLEVAS